jgi:hypothetical protein
VVLPTPPFWLATQNIWAMGCLSKSRSTRGRVQQRSGVLL